MAESRIPEELNSQLLAALQDKYDAGWRDGAANMRAAILRAAQMPMDGGSIPSSDAGDADVSGGEVKRAPHGAVRRAIIRALNDRPGQIEQQLGAHVERLDPAVSGKSVGAELRRMKNRLYYMDKGRWFLMAYGEKEAPGPSASDGLGESETQATEVGPDEASLAT